MKIGFFFSSRRRHTRYWRDWRFRRVLFRSARGRDLEGPPRGLQDTVANARQGKDARIVAESQLRQDLETPVPQVPYRELGRAEPEYRLAGKVLELVERTLHVGLEGRRLHAEDKLVAVGVAPDLVTPPRHLAYELGVRLGDVADYEKRRADLRLVQRVEQAVGRGQDRRRRPDLLSGEPPVHQLVPIFQVDRQRVDGHRALPIAAGVPFGRCMIRRVSRAA